MASRSISSEPADPKLRLVGPAEIRHDPSKLSDRVAIDLASRIVNGELPAGNRLPTEAELGDVFGVSRSVIRDAIRTLSAFGLVEVRQGVGMLVSSASDAAFTGALIIQLMRSELTVGDVFEARAAIETELAAVAAVRAEQRDFELIEQSLADFVAAVEVRDWAAAERCHLAFHLSLLRAARLPALEIIFAPLQEIIMISSLPPTIEGKDLADVWNLDDARRHAPIFEAVRSRDQEAARNAMRAHFPLDEGQRHAERRASMFRESQFVQALFVQLLRNGGTQRPQSSSGLLDAALDERRSGR